MSQNGYSELTLQPFFDEITALEFNSDTTQLAVGDKFGRIQIINPTTGRGICRFLQTKQVNVLKFSPNNNILASGGTDKRVEIWSTNSGKNLFFFSASQPIVSLDFSYEGRYLLCGCHQSFYIWDLETRTTLYNFEYSSLSQALFTFIIKPFSPVFFNLLELKCAKVNFDIKQINLYDQLGGNTSFNFSEALTKGKLVVRDFLGGVEGYVLPERLFPRDALESRNPDKIEVFGPSLLPTMQNFSKVPQKQLMTWARGIRYRVINESNQIEKSSGVIASANWNGKVPFDVLEGHNGRVYNIVGAENAYRLASVGTDGKIILWDIFNGTVNTFETGNRPITALGINKTGTVVVGGYADGTISIWE